MNAPRKHDLVLGLYPNTRGFAYALFEGPASPVDWGIAEARGKFKNRQCLQRIAVLFGQFDPIAVVIEDTTSDRSRRARRIRELHEAIGVLAETQGIPPHRYSRDQVRQAFAPIGATSKHTIAEAIGKLVPAFGNFIPPARRLWENEHCRMALFDAAALVITHYTTTQRRASNHL